MFFKVTSVLSLQLVLTTMYISVCSCKSIQEGNTSDFSKTLNYNHTSTAKKLYNINKTNSRIFVDEFETEDMDWEFDDKARKDGYKLTTPSQNPYSVMLITYSDKTKPQGICSGTLLSTQWVLSAAHCFVGEISSGYTQVEVFAGGTHSDRKTWESCEYCQRRMVSSHYVYPYPKYSENVEVVHDLSLVYVEKKFEKTPGVKPIGLTNSQWPYGGYEECRLTGFGIVQIGEANPDDYKRKTSYLETSSPCRCDSWMSRKYRSFMMCSKPREDYGLCSGDSGGGLICHREVVGVASGIITYADMNKCYIPSVGIKTKCGLRNTQSIFLQTYPYVNWINGYLTGGKPKPNRALENVESKCLLIAMLLLFLIL